MYVPKRPYGINQKIKGDRGRCDEDRDRRVESGDVFLKEGHRTCDEKGVDGGDLVVEDVFDAFWGVEYEDS